jgi:hypothetical protein
MQGMIITDRELVGCAAQVAVPAKVVDALRRAVYAEIGWAAQALDLAILARDREAHLERFRAPAQGLRESYALTNMLGWSRSEPSAVVHVELNSCGWTLMRALATALEFAEEDVDEQTRQDVEQRALAAQRECVGLLSDFIGLVQSRIDALAVGESEDDPQA